MELSMDQKLIFSSLIYLEDNINVELSNLTSSYLWDSTSSIERV